MTFCSHNPKFRFLVPSIVVVSSLFVQPAYGSKSAQLFHLESKNFLVNGHSNTDTDVQILIALREGQKHDQGG